MHPCTTVVFPVPGAPMQTQIFVALSSFCRHSSASFSLFALFIWSTMSSNSSTFFLKRCCSAFHFGAAGAEAAEAAAAVATRCARWASSDCASSLPLM